MSDITTMLDAAEQHSPAKYHWSVGFTVRVHDSLLPALAEVEPCDDCGQTHEGEDRAVIGDTIIVGCGENAEEAITRVKRHIGQESSYGLKIKPETFRLQSVRLLSVREI